MRLEEISFRRQIYKNADFITLILVKTWEKNLGLRFLFRTIYLFSISETSPFHSFIYYHNSQDDGYPYAILTNFIFKLLELNLSLSVEL